MTCLQAGDHVAPGGYGSKYHVSMFNRWVDGPLDEPLENTRRFRLRRPFVDRDPLLLHLDATLGFLLQDSMAKIANALSKTRRQLEALGKPML